MNGVKCWRCNKSCTYLNSFKLEKDKSEFVCGQCYLEITKDNTKQLKTKCQIVEYLEFNRKF